VVGGDWVQAQTKLAVRASNAAVEVRRAVAGILNLQVRFLIIMIIVITKEWGDVAMRFMKLKSIRQMTSSIDIGMIVALKEEFRELFSQLPSPQAIKDPETGVSDYLFEWGSPFPYQCAATFVGDMGLEKAALATDRFIKRRQPATIVLLGIAGGIAQDVNLGDVVVVTSVNNYLTKGKAVSGEGESFTFEAGGDPYRCSDDLVRAVQDLEFAHSQLYQQWQGNCRERLKEASSAEQIAELFQKNYLRETAGLIEGAIASGPVVGAAKEFIRWLKQINRNYLALEMEGGGMLGAVYSQADPKKTLILRGISDFGDERKKELDEIGKGGIRRYAMNNAIALLGKLLEAEVLPKQKAPIESERSSKSNAEILGTMTIQLNPQQKTKLREAVSDAFSEDELIIVLRNLGIELNHLSASNNTYLKKVSDLVEWLNRRSQIEVFLRAAQEANPENLLLNEFLISCQSPLIKLGS
jgi:nucleoside phosphorylase